MMTSMEAGVLQLQLNNPLLVRKLPPFLNQLLLVQLEKVFIFLNFIFKSRMDELTQLKFDSLTVSIIILYTSSSWKHSWRQLITPSIWPTFELNFCKI